MNSANNESFKKQFGLKNGTTYMAALYTAFGARTGRKGRDRG
jgi:hypothetical protein